MINDKNTDLISIIVPVYKAEKFIKKCVDSILNQTYENIEILLIDDESPDNSRAICDNLASIDKRIRVIHQKNTGVSGARNTGIRLARGDYLAFVDSDDWIDKEMISVLYNLMQKHNTPVSACGIEMVSEKGHVAYFSDNINETIVFSKNQALNELLDDIKLRNVCYNKLYKRELFEGISFPVGKIFEDLSIMYRIVEKCEKVVYTGKPLYCYYRSDGSLLRSIDPVTKFDKVTACMERAKYFRKHNPDLFRKASWLYVKCSLVVLANTSSSDNKLLKTRRKTRRTLLHWIKKYRSVPLPLKERVSCQLLNLGLPFYDLTIGTACRVVSRVKTNNKRMG